MVKVVDALNEALNEELAYNENVFIIGEEVGLSGGPKGVTKNLLSKFGNHRVLDAPISEMGFTGLAVGASFLGLRPIVDFMTWNFALQSIDQIINSCAKTCYMSGSKVSCPIVFRGPSGYNPGYAAQHTQEFFNYYGCVPGLKVVAPYTAKDHKSLLKSAIRDDNPVIFLENEYLYQINFEEELDNSLQPLDKARVLKEGNDVTVIGVSLSLLLIENVSRRIRHELEIIDLISLNPIDIETILKSVRKTGRVVIVDYSWPNYSVSSEISSQIYREMFGELNNRVECLNGKNTHVPYSETLETLFYPSEDELISVIDRIMSQ